MKAQKHCGVCGETHTWIDLPLVGIVEDDAGPACEIRNCPCGATLARAINLGPDMHRALLTLPRERQLYVGTSMRDGECDP